MLAIGIIDLFLAAMVYAGLPVTAAWAIGLLLGLKLLLGDHDWHGVACTTGRLGLASSIGGR